jgi:hypothetical protein
MIHDLVTGNRTATLYVRTDKNRVVIVATREGEIITLSSGPKRGEKAIPILREMRSAAVRVENGAIAFHSSSLAPTPVLLALMEADEIPDSDPSHPPREALPAVTPQFEKVRAILSRLLTEYLGPLAPMCCEQVLESLGNSLDGDRLGLAIGRMAAEAGSPEEARAFTERAWKLLGRKPTDGQKGAR